MTVTERPLFGSLELERLDGTAWVPYIADATRCSIRRGGTRSGLGIKTDVGLMSFTLHNAQDPLNGGAFKSGQTVRAVLKSQPDEVDYAYGFENYAEAIQQTYSEGFESGLGGWSADGLGTSSPHSGTQYAYRSYNTDFEQAVVFRSGFTYVSGKSYTLRAWVRLNVPGDVKVFSASGSYLNHTVTVSADAWTLLETTFTPDRTSDGIEFYYWDGSTGTERLDVDDIRITTPVITNNGLDGWTSIFSRTVVPGGRTGEYALRMNMGTFAGSLSRTFTDLQIGHQYTLSGWYRSDGDWTRVEKRFTATSASQAFSLPVPTGTTFWDDLKLTHHYTPTPVFTGTVSDIKASYPLNKNTGKKRVSVTVEVADAVKTHATTPRYGAMIGAPFYETFEQRITRYSGTALAPIEPPPVGAPIVRYSF